MVLLLLSQLALANPAGAPRDIAAGAPVSRALAVGVGPEGFETLSALLPEMLPTDPIEPGPMSQTSGVWCLKYSYDLRDVRVEYEVLSLRVTPGVGVLNVDVDLVMAVNAPDAPFSLMVDAICLIDEDCNAWMEPFPLSVSVPVTLTVEGQAGARYLDARVGRVGVAHDLTLDDVSGDCALNNIESVLNFFGMSLFDLVIDVVAGTLASEIDQALDEALAQAELTQTLEISGAVVDATVQPESVTVDPAGLALVLSARLAGRPDTCIASFDPGVSTSSGGPTPALDASAPVALHVAQDVMNQAVYAFWRAGLLCQEIGGDDLELPGIAFDTSLLGLLGGDPFRALFPDPGPLLLVTAPHVAPTVQVGGQHELDVAVRELELVFMAELDGRMARALGVSMDADIGADLAFDELTGELAVQLDVTPADLTISLAGPMLVSGVEDEVLATVTGVVGTLMPSLLGGLVGDNLAFALPTFDGIGLSSLVIAPSGASGDWLGVTGDVGLVSYADPSGGCGGEGCGGCAAGGGGASWLLVGLAAAVMRRRRR